MNRMRYILLTLGAAIGLIVCSCIDDDFTTSSSDILTFSRDTVTFDTVFTDLGTPTARLIVSNKASKSVNISSIRFKNPESDFTLNVDGMSGSDFRDVEIRGKDSIYIFIECRIDPTESNEPFLIEDKLEFVTNGVTQEVQVEAYGQNVTRLRAVMLTQDMTLTAERPYIVFDSLVVPAGRTLSIEPGAKVLFHDKASLIVRGVLDARGAPEKMIQLRGDRLDNVLPDVPYDLLAGQWAGIRIASESFGNKMEYVDMRSTSYGVTLDSCSNAETTKLTVINSWLHNSQKSVLDSRYGRVEAYGVCFSDAGGPVVSLTGGNCRMVQCTLANYYLFSYPSYPILSLYHIKPGVAEESRLPFISAVFENCIIYGLSSPLNIRDLKGADVFFRYVLWGADGEDDQNFIDCIWNEDPLFYTERSKYLFNYRVKPDSPAIQAGNPDYLNSLCRYDMDDYNRLRDGAPTLGAYAFVKENAPEE